MKPPRTRKAQATEAPKRVRKRKTSQLLMLVALLAIGAALVLALLQEVRRHGNKEELLAAAERLDGALLAYNQRHHNFPPTAEPREGAFRPDTLEPLVREGFLGDADTVTRHLEGTAVTAYDSPDLPKTNGDFWAVLVHGEDPTLQCLVADTDEYPGHEREILRGIYLIQGDQLRPVRR